MDHGRPLSFAISLPYDIAVQQGRDLGWREIAVEVEVLCICGLVAPAQVDLSWWWVPLGREDEGYVVASRVGCGLLNLVDCEVLDGDGFDGMVGVSEFGAIEFGGGGPCGEDSRLRIGLVDEADGALVEDDEVAIGEVVLRGEGVGRVDPDAGEERRSAENGKRPPLAEMAMPGGGAEEEDERIHREQVACQKRAAEDGEGNPVGDEDDRDGFELRLCDGWWRGGRDLNEEDRYRADDRDEHVHVGGQMEETMPETESDAVGVEICGGVVAKELGVAEDEAGLVIVIGVPRYQGEDRH